MRDMETYILAGGQSRRMGRDKGLVPFKGKPLITHVIDTVKPYSKFIYILSSNPEYSKFEIPLLTDLIRNKGPLAGIYSALENSGNKKALILSCDVPFITTNAIEQLLGFKSDKMAVVAKTKSQIHPLFGIYSKECIPIFKDLIAHEKLSVIQALNHISTDYLTFDDEGIFRNMNELSDLEP